MLGLLAKLPRSWDYLRYRAKVAYSKARFCLCQAYEGKAFVTFKAFFHFSEEGGFLSKKVQPLWRLLKPLGLTDTWTCFRFSSWHVFACIFWKRLASVHPKGCEAGLAWAKGSFKRKKGELIKMSGAEPSILHLISHWIITTLWGKYD